MRSACVKVIKVTYFALSGKISEVILFQGLLSIVLLHSNMYGAQSRALKSVLYIRTPTAKLSR